MNSSNDTSPISDLVFLERFVLMPIYILWNLFYMIILYIYLRYSKEFPNFYYILVKGLAVSDILQMITIIYNGMYGHIDHSYLNDIGWQITDIFFNTVQLSSNFASYALHLSLTVNRAVAIIAFQSYKQIFTKRKTVVLTCVCFLFGFINFAPSLVIKIIHFKPYEKFWFFDDIYPYSSMDKIYLQFTSVTMVVISSFACCFSRFNLKRSPITNSLYKMEFKMFIQNIFMSIMLIIQFVLLFVQTEDTPAVALRFAYFSCCGMNSIIGLAMNTILRNLVKVELKKIGICCKFNDVVPIVTK